MTEMEMVRQRGNQEATLKCAKCMKTLAIGWGQQTVTL